MKLKHPIAVATLAAGLILASAFQLPAQGDTNLPPGIQDVIKLTKAGLSEEVILAQIRNSGASYNLNADQIIYLHDQGVTQNEIKALMGPGTAAPQGVAPTAPPPASPVPAPATPPPTDFAPPASPGAPPVAAPSPGFPDGAPTAPPTLPAFQSELAPYGTWVDAGGFGLCWRPTVTLTDPFWRPYFDQGHWVYTDGGWYWQSDYSWGDVVFHYGRWYRDSVGWIWAPGYDWAPAWVCWRHAEGYCGWAPLPPAAVFRAGVGLSFRGRVGLDLDFGLGPEMFAFVGYDRFWDHNLRPFLLPRERIGFVYGHSFLVNGYRMDHGRFIVEGPGRERIAALTHREIRVEEPLHRGFRGHEEGGRRIIREDRHDR